MNMTLLWPLCDTITQSCLLADTRTQSCDYQLTHWSSCAWPSDDTEMRSRTISRSAGIQLQPSVNTGTHAVVTISWHITAGGIVTLVSVWSAQNCACALCTHCNHSKYVWLYSETNLYRETAVNYSYTFTMHDKEVYFSGECMPCKYYQCWQCQMLCGVN